MKPDDRYTALQRAYNARGQRLSALARSQLTLSNRLVKAERGQAMITEIERYITEHGDWCPKDTEEKRRFMSLAICGEAGELANYVKKDWRGDPGAKARRPKMKKEIADIVNYALMEGLTLGMTPWDVFAAMVTKFREVERRAAYKNRNKRKKPRAR